MISLIATVRNESATIIEWWQSLQAQSIQPDEWVIVDGGSTDGTWEWLQATARTAPNLKIKQVVGNIATGRNAAIELAQGDVIVVTDAGCTYSPHWLAEIIRPILTGEGNWSATAFGPDLSRAGWYQTALAALTIPQKAEFQVDWLPSSRSVAFPKALWHTVGGYPTWLPFSEDVVFDRALLAIGKLALVREPLVFWAPRPSTWAYLRQVFNYTRSEGHAGLNPERQATRFGVYLFLGGVILVGSGWLASSLLVLGLVGYLPKYAGRWLVYSQNRSWALRFLGLGLVAGLVLAGDVSKMAGWLYGKFELAIGRVRKPV